jgi:hypothetical protein
MKNIWLALAGYIFLKEYDNLFGYQPQEAVWY